MIKKDIGRQIKKYRERNHLLQVDLAEKLGVTKQCISSWECDRTQPSAEMLEEIAKALNCSSADINIPTSVSQTDIQTIEAQMRNMDTKYLDRIIAYANYLKSRMES